MEPARLLGLMGLLLLLGLALDALGRRTRLPRVTLLLLLGIGLGPESLGLLDPGGDGFVLITNLALVVVGFLLGGRLTAGLMRQHGRHVLSLSGGVAVASILFVAAGLSFLGVPPALALLLGGIATATDPAATLDVVEETGARGPFARTLLGIVAVDDAWGLIAFSLLLAAATAIAGTSDLAAALGDGARDLLGAVALGVALGVPAAHLTGRVEPGEPSLLEGLGVVLLCGGLALHFEVSFLLASMVLGAVIANLARHHTRPFHAIEGVERPLLIFFFVLSGASLRLEMLPAIGWIGAGYVALRALGRIAGGWIGGTLGGSPVAMRRWMGVALLPQAGVALGMALVAGDRLPELRDAMVSIVVGTTVLFELVGPLLTRRALLRAGAVTP